MLWSWPFVAICNRFARFSYLFEKHYKFFHRRCVIQKSTSLTGTFLCVAQINFLHFERIIFIVEESHSYFLIIDNRTNVSIEKFLDINDRSPFLPLPNSWNMTICPCYTCFESIFNQFFLKWFFRFEATRVWQTYPNENIRNQERFFDVIDKLDYKY